MTCLNSAHFSIGINGEEHGFFKGERVLRPGDPIKEIRNRAVKYQIQRSLFTVILGIGH